MANPVAHEGNPLTDSLTVTTGDVLTTAELSIIVPFPVDPGPPPLPTPPSPVDGAISTCPDVFNWVRFDGRNDIFHLTEEPCNLSTGWTGNDPPIYIKFDTNLAVVITPTKDICYGMISGPMVADNASPDIIEYYSTLRQHVSGNPFSGPCIIATSNDGTVHDIDAVAIIVDFDNNLAYLLQWNGASLLTIENATTLYSAAYTPAATDIFYFQSWAAGGSPSLYAAIVDFSANFASPKWEIDLVGTSLNPNTPRYGFICTGDGTGQAIWGSAISSNSCSGGSGIFHTIRVETDNLAP